MAVIKGKDLKDLSSWNDKELRKLKINLNNRIQTLGIKPKAKELSESNPLHGFGIDQCRTLLTNVMKAERDLAKS